MGFSSTSPLPRKSSYELHPARSLQRPLTVLAKLKRAWLSTQVSHRGKYSIERLLALGEYTRRTSRLRVFFVCVGTPLPMIVFVTCLECVPLADPSAGWKSNYGLWIRSAVICGAIASTVLVELKHLIEGVEISVRQAAFVLVCVMVGDTALCTTAAAYLAFPLPFMSILMVPPLLMIVAGLLRLAFGASGFQKMLAHPAQMFGFVLFIFAQALTLVIYPVYQVLFDAAVGTSYELPVILLLPFVNMLTRNVVASSISYMEDMIPESVIFTVDFFNAVYVITCMQRTSSTITVAAIMAVDIFHTFLALRSLYRTAYEIHQRLRRELGGDRDILRLLEVACSLCQHIDKFERQDYSQIQLRSCLPHVLSSTGRSFLARLEKYPLKPAIKAHRRRFGSISPSMARNQDNAAPPTGPALQVIGWQSAKRLSAKVYAISTFNRIPVKPAQQDSTSKTRSDITSNTVPQSRILQRVVEILFTTECLVLTEYLESFIPLFYANFICIIVQLPSAQYHTELEGITQENVRDTVQSVFLYGLLECSSFLILITVIHRTIGIHALYHLAFVLETQMPLIQTKLTVWMLLTLTCRVVHYGEYEHVAAILYSSLIC
ncbi:unnamed protein product [Phytophthora lilii]|uniref:Unnamed protein product n=1 Tax=Phytophthora lilii TaxID=2077276 RepID=A0A9W6THI0_9STRA|nr:unnamed protein product [Phytophthora lilii]